MHIGFLEKVDVQRDFKVSRCFIALNSELSVKIFNIPYMFFYFESSPNDLFIHFKISIKKRRLRQAARKTPDSKIHDIVQLEPANIF